MCVDDIPIEEFHGELLHYSRPASLQSQATSPNETPLRCAFVHVLPLNTVLPLREPTVIKKPAGNSGDKAASSDQSL